MSEAIGGIAEEAAKLFSAVEDWCRERVGGLHQGPECVVCPVCQVLAMLRTSAPDVFEHLADASTSLLLALRAAVDSPSRRGSAPVQHIDIT